MSEYAYASFIISTTGCFLGVFSIGLNILFLIAMHLLKDKFTAYHRYLQNLAVSDLLASCAFLILQNWPTDELNGLIRHLDNAILLEGLPYVIRSLPWMFFTSYLLTLSCLTMNQYVAVCRPWKYAKWVTPKNICISLVFVWSLSSLQLLVPFTILFVLYFVGDPSLTGQTLYSVSTIEMQVWMGVFILSTISNISANLFIYRKIRHLKLKRGLNNSSTNMDSVNIRMKQATFITVTLLLLASVFCRLPFPFVSIVELSGANGMGTETAQLLGAIVVLLLYLNFFVDPIIYLFRLREVRKSYKQFFMRHWPCCFKMSDRYCRQTASMRLMTTTVDGTAAESCINVTVDNVELRARGNSVPTAL